LSNCRPGKSHDNKLIIMDNNIVIIGQRSLMLIINHKIFERLNFVLLISSVHPSVPNQIKIVF
jgi:hypothetical protein